METVNDEVSQISDDPAQQEEKKIPKCASLSDTPISFVTTHRQLCFLMKASSLLGKVVFVSAVVTWLPKQV